MNLGRIISGGVGFAAGWSLSKLDKRRRHMAVDRAAAAARRTKAEAVRQADYNAGKVRGAAHAMSAQARPEREYDDTTLARKVESELFRPADAPKGKVSVNVANGVVELRGQVSSQSSIDALEDTARQVEGVHEVHNLLHVGA